MSASSFPDPATELDLLTRMSLKQLLALRFNNDRELKVTLDDTLNVNLSSSAKLDGITNWGKQTEYQYTQMLMHQDFQQSFRRNLVVS
jgi:hypothetical protein